MRSIGLWPWFKDQGLIPLDMPFAVCNLPRIMRLLQSDIVAKRTPLPGFRLKLNAQYLEQKCIALVIEACGNPRPQYQGCRQCQTLGLECISADGLGPAAEEVANSACARCLFNEKSWMGVGKSCSLREQGPASVLAPQPFQAHGSLASQTTNVPLTRQLLHQSAADQGNTGGIGISSATVQTATTGTNRHALQGYEHQSTLPTAPQNLLATGVSTTTHLRLLAPKPPTQVQTQQRLHNVPQALHPQRYPSPSSALGNFRHPPNNSSTRAGQQDLVSNVTEQARVVVVDPPAANMWPLSQQKPAEVMEKTRQQPATCTQSTLLPQDGTGSPSSAAQAGLKRKRGRPPNEKTVTVRPPMQVWVGNIPIERYSNEQLAAGISVFTAELDRRKNGTPYPAHFNPAKTIHTPAMPVTTFQGLQPSQDTENYPHTQSKETATTNALPEVPVAESDQTNPPRPFHTSIFLRSQASQAKSNSADCNTAGNLGVKHGPNTPNATAASQLITSSSSGPRRLPSHLEHAQLQQAIAAAQSVVALQHDKAMRKMSETRSMEQSATAPVRRPSSRESCLAGRDMDDDSGSTPVGSLPSTLSTTPWGQVCRSPSEAVPVRPSTSDGPAEEPPAVFIKGEPVRSPGTGVPLEHKPREQQASIATAALSVLAKTDEDAENSGQSSASPLVKTERDA